MPPPREQAEPPPGRGSSDDPARRRRAPRVDRESFVEHRRYSFGERRELETGPVIDISTGGMQLETGDRRYEKGDLLELCVYLPGLDLLKTGFYHPDEDPDRLRVLATVRWTEEGPPARAGVQWEAIDADHARALEAYIEKARVEGDDADEGG